MRDFVLVYATGWEGLYFDGKLVTQAKKVPMSEVVEISLRLWKEDPPGPSSYRQVECDAAWMAAEGVLPDAFEDVALKPSPR
jgi:hypothetical protein